MARFLPLAFAACALTIGATVVAVGGCDSGSFATEAPADDSGNDGAFGDVATDAPIDTAHDTAPTDGAPPPCASPPCSCEPPTPTRCGPTCVDTTTDIDHCGSCVDSCGKVDHGTATCSGSACTLKCETGFHACSKLCVKNGSLANCGPSCSPCPAPGKNANATCDGSKCGVSCYLGFADCNGGTDGCETDISLNANCGACGNACTGSSLCAPKAGGGFACVSDCTGSTTKCSGVCVDTTTSPTNCGGCGHVCDAVPHARTTCSSSTCGFLCDVGYHVCAGACVPDDAVTSCGPSSCTACPTPPHTTATCDGTACGTTCVAGFKDCNGSPGDGCEVDLSDPKTCGSCGGACPVPPHGSATCTGGVCGFTCNAPWIALGDRCALFGGAYETDSSTCGGACSSPNPFTKDCTCPPGFLAEKTGASSQCDETSRGSVVVCNAPAPTGPLPSGVDWAGAYSKRATACAPATDCFTANPFTGTCTCPSGTTPIVFDVEDAPPGDPCALTTGGGTPLPPADATIGGGTVMTQLVFCGGGPGGTTSAPITFFGAFETLDDGTCTVKNPSTSACSCPSGSKPQAIHVMTPKSGFVSYCLPG